MKKYIPIISIIVSGVLIIYLASTRHVRAANEILGTNYSLAQYELAKETIDANVKEKIQKELNK
jgi:hypothetical protein